MNLDEAKAAFSIYQKEVKEYAANLNESDTRSKLIDALLLKVLGWSELDVGREGKIKTGYFDYLIKIPGFQMLIEAKKEVIELNLPAKHNKVKIGSIYKNNKDVFDQIRSYGFESNCQNGIITNGTQFIFTELFNINGIEWTEKQCLIFNGIEDVENRFLEFYENLSKSSVSHYGGFKFNLILEKKQFKTVLSTLTDSNKELVRNSLSVNLIPIINNIFGEIYKSGIDSDTDFIRKCFVENGETKKNRNEIQKIFSDNAPNLSNIIRIKNTLNLKNAIESELTNDVIDIKKLTPPKPIVIIGSRGAGKTTFINYLLHNDEGAKYTENHLAIYLDIRKIYNNKASFEQSAIAEKIIKLISEKYENLELTSIDVLKRIYAKEIKEKTAGVWNYFFKNDLSKYEEKIAIFLESACADFLQHLSHLNKYLIRERRKRLIIVIDNSDQYDISFQKNIFLFAHSLAQSSFCNTLISLREGYYYKWRSSPPFDAYESNVYHVSAPKYADILQKRIDYALSNIHSQSTLRGNINSGAIVEIPEESVYIFLNGLKNSIFSSKNNDLLNFLDYTTFPDLREGLRIFNLYLTSGHTQVEENIVREYSSILAKKTNQTIPIHEFVKSIGLENKLYYNSESSVIHNLFTPPAESTDHFLLTYILRELSSATNAQFSTTHEIFSSTIFEIFTEFGYRNNSIKSAVETLIKFRLIDSDLKASDVEGFLLDNTSSLKITLKGHHYINDLIFKFYYIDLILQDTPIFEDSCFSAIKSVFPLTSLDGKRNLTKRVLSCREFLNYLLLQEKKQPSVLLAKYGGIASSIIKEIENDFVRINQILQAINLNNRE
jgi:GTPase SAR1 family protein